MLEQPLVITGYLEIQSFNLITFPNTVSKATLVTLPFYMPCQSIGHQVLPTQPLPKEAEDFPGSGNYPKDAQLPTYLGLLQAV